MHPVVVVGGGAVGLAAALALAPDVPVVVLEKDVPGAHQSGRNSGVIHAGYNLRPGSRKARFCIDGNRRMHAFCEEQGVGLLRNGILVVARTEGERSVLEELRRRAAHNEVPVQWLEQEEVPDLEPAARGVAALHAPTGSSVDAGGYVAALHRAAEAQGAVVRSGVRVQTWTEGPDHVRVHTEAGTIDASLLLNAAGLHADRIAGALAPDLRVIPFRGSYARLRRSGRDLVRGHIYSAPDLAFPFLGVHLSRRWDGDVHVGPGAMPALGRETYGAGAMHGRDLWDTLRWPGTWHLLRDPRIRRLVLGELHKSLRLRAVWKEANRLVPSLQPRDLARGVPAGHRAQLVDREGRLVEDIVVRETARTVHVLNAVSPGLTCSLPFGEHLAHVVRDRL